MKRLLIQFMCILAVATVQAQQINLKYENKTNTLPDVMQQYFNMQKVKHLSASITGDFKGKRVRLKKVSCDKGTFSERELFPDAVHIIFKDSIKTFDFMAIPYGQDSVCVSGFYPKDNYPLFNDTVPGGMFKILMETYTPGDGPDIPIMSYSSGIPTKFGSYYCGLRDSGVNPWKWHEKYGIDNYVFYTVRFEEDTPPDPNEPNYIKISL
ncbi:MAG: hypothetical protein HDS01_05070 [Bacteroides sp.]|nr:hypothetical protein [Bacteroides sp.]